VAFPHRASIILVLAPGARSDGENFASIKVPIW
jgi:hypothetical protein